MMHPETRRQTTRLFVALEYGEQLARQCALQQMHWIDSPRARRFLGVQARQEATHAGFYRRAADWLTPGHHYSIPPSLQRYAARLQQALDRNDLCDSLTGSQIVLEGFGEQIISRLNRGMDNHGIGFRRLRRILLHQEQSHYAFGLRMLQQHVSITPAAAGRIPELASDYLQQVNDMVHEMSDIFVSLDEDPDEYCNDLLDGLPDWIRPS
jgi:predicted transcriptional regulator